MIDSEKLDYYLGCQHDDLNVLLQKEPHNERLIGAIKAFEMIRAQISLMDYIRLEED
jgi:hypothetical protein